MSSCDLEISRAVSVRGCDYSREVGKRGPKSSFEKVKWPPKMGMKGRMVKRLLLQRTHHCLKVYKNGWQQMWNWAPELLTRWKIKRPGQYDKDNIMGGELWGTPSEYRNNHPLSGPRCARVLEHAHSKRVPYDTLRQMRKTCSYIYMLHEGVGEENFAVVNSMMKSLDKRQCGEKRKQLVPTKIMNPEQLRDSLLKEWRGPDSGMCLVNFLQGGLGNWHWNVLGARKGCDLTKLKNSEDHFFDEQRRFFTTAYVDGRSKLPLHKNGTRPWNAWHLCMCPGGMCRPTKSLPTKFGKQSSSAHFLPSSCPLLLPSYYEVIIPREFKFITRFHTEAAGGGIPG